MRQPAVYDGLTLNKGEAMKVTLVYNPNFRGGSVRVHKTGCRDIGQDRRGATTVYDMTAETRNEVAVDFFEDFINEGSMTPLDALNETHFLPCCDGEGFVETKEVVS